MTGASRARGTSTGWAEGRWSDQGGFCAVMRGAGDSSSDAAAGECLECSIANRMTIL
jgi:hypothetical protein